ncbi:hypothetical protein Pfo_009212 [Paulownia fortunei]|nr:hypothetical protein Pfo_009212 [Paulownia fortunei]
MAADSSSTHPESSIPNPAPKLPPPSFTAVAKAAAMASATTPSLRSSSKSLILDSFEVLGTRTSYQNTEAVIFSDSETSKLSEPFQFALIGKFSHGMPPLKQLQQQFVALKLSRGHSVRFLNSKHILIILSNDADYTRLWLRRIWFFEGFPMRLFKWSPHFDPKLESAIVPVWIRLPELPVHLFEKAALKAIAELIANKTRLSVARIYVEVDLRQALKNNVYLGISSQMILQKIIYENVPRYCTDCSHLGHDTASCYGNGNAPRPVKTKKSNKGKEMEPQKVPARNKGKEQVVQTCVDVAGRSAEFVNTPVGEGGVLNVIDIVCVDMVGPSSEFCHPLVGENGVIQDFECAAHAVGLIDMVDENGVVCDFEGAVSVDVSVYNFDNLFHNITNAHNVKIKDNRVLKSVGITCRGDSSLVEDLSVENVVLGSEEVLEIDREGVAHVRKCLQLTATDQDSRDRKGKMAQTSQGNNEQTRSTGSGNGKAKNVLRGIILGKKKIFGRKHGKKKEKN